MVKTTIANKVAKNDLKKLLIKLLSS